MKEVVDTHAGDKKIGPPPKHARLLLSYEDQNIKKSSF